MALFPIAPICYLRSHLALRSLGVSFGSYIEMADQAEILVLRVVASFRQCGDSWNRRFRVLGAMAMALGEAGEEEAVHAKECHGHWPIGCLTCSQDAYGMVVSSNPKMLFEIRDLENRHEL